MGLVRSLAAAAERGGEGGGGSWREETEKDRIEDLGSEVGGETSGREGGWGVKTRPP